MENFDRKHALETARSFLAFVRDWDYCMVDQVVRGGIREYTKGYRVEYEEPGVKVYEDKAKPRSVLIVARAHGMHYLHRIDYGEWDSRRRRGD